MNDQNYVQPPQDHTVSMPEDSVQEPKKLISKADKEIEKEHKKPKFDFENPVTVTLSNGESYTMNPKLFMSDATATKLKAFRYYRIPLSIKQEADGTTTQKIENMDQFQANNRYLTYKLISLYYEIDKPEDKLTAKDINKLYEPIEELDPLDLQEDDKKLATSKDG